MLPFPVFPGASVLQGNGGGERCYFNHTRTEILLIKTMPIYILLKQLITCQEDTQSFRTIAIIFLCIHSVPPLQLPWLQFAKIQPKLPLIAAHQCESELITAIHSQSF